MTLQERSRCSALECDCQGIDSADVSLMATGLALWTEQLPGSWALHHIGLPSPGHVIHSSKTLFNFSLITHTCTHIHQIYSLREACLIPLLPELGDDQPSAHSFKSLELPFPIEVPVFKPMVVPVSFAFPVDLIFASSRVPGGIVWIQHISRAALSALSH